MSWLDAFKIVYSSNPILYIGFAILVFVLFWIFFNIYEELLYFDPILYFYLPDDAIVGFILSTASALLLGVVIPMNIYLLKNSKIKLDKSLISSSFLTFITSFCASCSSIGFIIISTFGSAGIIATSFLTNYQIPLRLVSLGILILALYTVSRKLMNNCSINHMENNSLK
ncbi:MAG: hypothetical protein AB7V56_10815 [Candidatus Nitrosocosmicus sp.]